MGNTRKLAALAQWDAWLGAAERNKMMGPAIFATLFSALSLTAFLARHHIRFTLSVFAPSQS
jgi:hypothetical protein